MTVTYPLKAPNGVQVLRAWLLPLGHPVAAKRAGNATGTSIMVNRVAGTDDKVTDSSTYSVHTFATDYTDAETLATTVHNRILTLGPPLAPQRRVTVGSETFVADCVETDQVPVWLKYSDTVERFVARYHIDFRYVAAP